MASFSMTDTSSFSFSRVWIQGVVVESSLSSSYSSTSSPASFSVDDGTGVIVVDVRAIVKKLASRKIEYEPPSLGNYILCIGKLLPPDETIRRLTLKAHKVLAIDDPNREALWNAEALHHFKHFQK